MVRWEYRVLHVLTAPELADIGEDGWEFVTVEFDDDGEILNAFAKRPKGGGGGGNHGSGGGGGGGGGGDGQRRRRRRKGGGGGGNPNVIGPMS